MLSILSAEANIVVADSQTDQTPRGDSEDSTKNKRLGTKPGAFSKTMEAQTEDKAD